MNGKKGEEERESSPGCIPIVAAVALLLSPLLALFEPAKAANAA